MNPLQIITFILSILHVLPHSPMQACIEHRQTEISQLVLQASEQDDIPPGVIMVIGFMETHMGCDNHEGGGWGAPIDGRHRHTAGTIFNATHILRRGYHDCGTWLGSITRFRSGSCSLPPTDDRLIYVRRAMYLIPRIYQEANIPMDFSLTAHRGMAAPAIMLTSSSPASPAP